MFISKFSVEDWQGNQNKGLLAAARNWTQIEAAIRELDGQHKTLVTLEADGETHMAVGGGEAKYLVYVTFDNQTFHYLIDPSKSNVEESLVVGGQKGDYPARLCVDLSTALRAAKTFAEVGTIERAVIWEQDGIVEPV